MFEGRLLFSYGDARRGGSEFAKQESGVELDIEELQMLANLTLERSDNLKKRKIKPHTYDIMTNLIGEKYPDKDPRRGAALKALGHMFGLRAEKIRLLREQTGKKRAKRDGPLAEARRIWPRDGKGQHHMDFEESHKPGRR